MFHILFIFNHDSFNIHLEDFYKLVYFEAFTSEYCSRSAQENNKCFNFVEISLDDIPNRAVVARMTMNAEFEADMGTPGSAAHTELTGTLTTAVSRSH